MYSHDKLTPDLIFTDLIDLVHQLNYILVTSLA